MFIKCMCKFICPLCNAVSRDKCCGGVVILATEKRYSSPGV